MATEFAGARRMITANYPAYKKQMEQSLTLKPFGSKVKVDNMTLSLTFSLPADSVVVFVW